MGYFMLPYSIMGLFIDYHFIFGLEKRTKVKTISSIRGQRLAPFSCLLYLSMFIMKTAQATFNREAHTTFNRELVISFIFLLRR